MPNPVESRTLTEAEARSAAAQIARSSRGMIEALTGFAESLEGNPCVPPEFLADIKAQMDDLDQDVRAALAKVVLPEIVVRPVPPPLAFPTKPKPDWPALRTAALIGFIAGFLLSWLMSLL